MPDIDQLARWLRKTQGRDKLCKILQYVCRLLANYNLPRSQYNQLIYFTLFQAIREARKLFRLFKSVDEYHALKQLIFYGQEGINTLLQIAYRWCYLIYWTIDNVSVAAKIKIIKADWRFLHALSLKIRCVALVISLASCFLLLRNKQMNQTQRKAIFLKAIMDTAQLLPSGKDSKLFWWISEQTAGIGGLISSFISTYLIWKECELV